MKRIVLFLATNIAVLLVISIIFNIFGLNKATSLGGVLAGAAVIGFTGSIMSLLMSKWIAKKSVGAEVITQPANETEAWLVQTVENQARQWNLKTPEVAIYDSPEMNAFATGASKNNSLVAVSTGLLSGMTRDEVEAVLAHEMAHVGNGDMVTLTLIQGVVNTFVVFFAKIIAGFLTSSDDEGEENGGWAYFAVNMVLQILFGFLASLITMWFSRQREYRADAGAAQMMGQSGSMQKALARLGGINTQDLPQGMASMGIFGSVGMLLSSHPPLEKRIAALQQLSI